MTSRQVLNMLAICGTAAGMAATATAETPTLINISGATLQRSLIIAPAISNDFIDVDGDGFTTASVGGDQLVPGQNLPVPTDPILPALQNKQWWHLNYRSVGSINGLRELIQWGQTYATLPTDIVSNPVDQAHYNRTQYINLSASTNAIFNAGNPGAIPTRSSTPAGFLQSPAVRTDGTGGIRIDIAPLDVPVLWAVNDPGSTSVDAQFSRTPGTDGYGRNPTLARNKDGTVSAQGNTLAELTGTLNINQLTPDNDTLFDNIISFAPVGVMANLGTGKTQLDKTDVAHYFCTGRGKDGQNLVVVTRDSGSGTRNAFMNPLGVDPSWGIGDNVGIENAASANNQLGANFLPSNKGGSGALRDTVANHRLAIGSNGLDTGVGSGGWYTAGRAEYLAVRNDNKGGTIFARPTTSNLLDNSVNGYQIGGPSSWVTIGDPRSAPVNKGGDAGNTNPDMRNVEAAALVNNLTRSVAAFNAAPGADATLFSPGEFAALNFVTLEAQDFVQDPFNPNVTVPNPNLNQTLQDFIRNNSSLNAIQNVFGAITLNGKNPTRASLAGSNRYSDSVALGASYLSQGGAALANGANCLTRNRISGDFNGDGARDINDATEMLRAWEQRNGGAAWVAPAGSGPIAGAAGADACIEILGDFNGDGNFGVIWNNTTLAFAPDFADVRYWADGLAVDNLKVINRCNGFIAVDQAWIAISGNDNNFFNTVLANPNAIYNAGDSTGDVAGPTGRVTPGFAPIGADGVINAFDIDYVWRMFAANPRVTDGELNWSNIREAIGGDLSADINGDLVVNQADVCKLFAILETRIGDIDLDGDIDAADLAVIAANLGQTGLGYAGGDLNCDGVTNAADAAIAAGADPCNAPPCDCTRGQGDANGDCDVNGADLSVLLSQFGTSVAPNTGADFNNSGSVNGADLSVLLSNFGCNTP